LILGRPAASLGPSKKELALTRCRRTAVFIARTLARIPGGSLRPGGGVCSDPTPGSDLNPRSFLLSELSLARSNLRWRARTSLARTSVLRSDPSTPDESPRFRSLGLAAGGSDLNPRRLRSAQTRLVPLAPSDPEVFPKESAFDAHSFVLRSDLSLARLCFAPSF
jgi:hypothetical protein